MTPFISFCFTGLAHGANVLQSPPSLLLRSGEAAELHCSHSISGYNTILWYRRSAGAGALELLGHLYHNNENPEPGMEKSITLKGDGKKSGTLTISNNTSADNNVVYFCAACKENPVILTPSILWGHTQSSAQMNCSHSLGATYFQMYWYKQRPPEGIQLIVFTSTASKPEFGNLGRAALLLFCL
ncbi:hypothetical protein JZ751_003127 [Albula glossodonta]|uniref:Ig-like domain-containing protein n=1 Tax=Albula glossodonta TaxID=121402 RepID=A0A8T2N8X7_9TELE|nr:hypothetical protein JZ751_003127 [Albula glossodonta]